MQLLHRTSRVVTPTEAGSAFAEEARRVLAGFELAVAAARRSGGARPVLRMGCVPYLPLERVRRFLDALSQRYPDSEPEVTHMVAAQQLEALIRGKLDFGIVHQAGDHDGIDPEPLFAGEALVVFLPKEHRLAANEVLTPDDLAEEVQLAWSRAVNPPLWDDLAERCQAAGYHFREVEQLGGAMAGDLLLGVAAGHGVALGVPSFDPAGEGSGIVARCRLDPPVFMPDTAVAWRSDPPSQLRPAVEAVREAARALRASSERDRDSVVALPAKAS